MNSHPKISVILPCRNEAGHIEVCLRSLLAQEQPAGGMEILVVDGMSDDGTREILQRMAAQNSNLQIIDNPEKITPCGLNAAIRAAKGDIIVRMDAHTEYAPDYVMRCVETLEKTGADNVGGPARTKPVTFMQRAIGAAYHTGCVVGGARFHNVDYQGEVDTVTYGCWPKSSFERFGLFDESLVRNEDDEHNLRIIRGGGRIWQSPAIKSWYSPRDSLKLLFKQYFQYGYWRARVIQKHILPAAVRHLVPGAFVFILLILFLLLLASVHKTALVALCIVVSVYALFILTASVLAARRAGWSLIFPLPFVVATYHISYGMGFLLGMFDFFVFRRSRRCTELSR